MVASFNTYANAGLKSSIIALDVKQRSNQSTFAPLLTESSEAISDIPNEGVSDSANLG